MERLKVREARQKRKHESRKQLGLEMFSEDKVEEYRNKVKNEIEQKIKRPQSQDVVKKVVMEKRVHSAMNRDMKDVLQQENKKIEPQQPEEDKRDKKEILKEMKLKRKQQE